MKIGYSFWGYLGDTKYDKNGIKASTPDGNAFYSWSIINKLQEEGDLVYSIMPDRDFAIFCVDTNKAKQLFDSWCTEQRRRMYTTLINIWHGSNLLIQNSGYDMIRKMAKSDELYKYLEKYLDGMDIVLHEWRMPIEGRNVNVKDKKLYQPDLDIQNCILKYYEKHPSKKLIIFDLDYKLNVKELAKLSNGGNNIHVFELGYKWNGYSNAHHVEIPFDFRYINEFDLTRWGEPYGNLVYVGNRYERDWCIDKYIPTEIKGVIVYGNWLESGRDSDKRWPNIKFGHRAQTSDMDRIYGTSKATILLAKEEYLKESFMTARILEAVFYGCVPLFIEEYGKETIEKYAGKLAPYLTVKSKADVIDCIYALEDENIRIETIKYLREHLKFMDVSHFVDKIYEVAYNGIF